ncbi:MAG: hypothetical protein O9352_21385, partial [Rhizobium sp.]|nr:hypothetical protein [Rhizobium sp.]
AAFAPASCSRSTPMICSSVNLCFFIRPSSDGPDSNQFWRKFAVAGQSMPAVKAFTYYRRKLGISELAESTGQDRVNFHSFRRWFITKALQAGQPELVVQIVVGHKPQSVAASVYLGGLTMEQMKECVEAVKLPS